MIFLAANCFFHFGKENWEDWWKKKANKSQIFEKMQTNLKSAVETAGRQLTRGRPRSQTGATGGEPIHFLFVFLPFFVTLCNIFVFFGFL